MDAGDARHRPVLKYARFFSPPLRGGVAATSMKYREASFYGADGVVIKFQTEFGLYLITTPSARVKDAARRLLDRAATPAM